MKRNSNKYNFWKSKLFYRLVSLLIALLLVAYVSNLNNGNIHLSSGEQNSPLSAIKTKTLTVPVQLNIDSSEYYVSNYPKNVKVRLSGPISLVDAANNTRNFSVTANLRNMGIGNHRVNLDVQNLNHELKYRILPNQISLNIAKRKTVNLPVKLSYDATNLNSKYQLGKPEMNIENATVTGAANKINLISRIVAPIQISANVKHDINKNVMLEAEDNTGKILDVLISPKKANVDIPIKDNEASKQVSLEFKLKNPRSNTTYNIKSNTKKVVVYGSKKAISKLKDKVVVPVDVSKVPLGNYKDIVELKPFAKDIYAFSKNEIMLTIVSFRRDNMNFKKEESNSQNMNSSSDENEIINTPKVTTNDNSYSTDNVKVINNNQNSNSGS